MQHIMETIRKTEQEFIEIRHQIHQHPEVGFEENKTSDLVANKLAEWGYEVHRGLAKTGVVGVLKNGTSNKKIGDRTSVV